MKRLLILSLTLICPVLAADLIPRGTNIVVRTDEKINVRSTEGDGRIYRGVIDRDVVDRDGNMIVPRGSNAELIVRRTGRDEVAVDLDSISVNGHRYGVAATETQAEAGRTGSNGKRVGAFAGGGAVLGTILGAVAGGGKGAAIGAAAGAGAGAAAGFATRGRELNVPVESLLTFRLEQPIRIDAPDRGYDRDGHHYHNR
jgi:hypothetical protein